MNNVAYQIRVRNAAQQLSGVGSPTMRQFKYRNASGGTLGACDCAHASPRAGGSPRLRAVRSQRIGAYKLVTGVRSGLSGIGMTEKPVAALLPVSDRKAVANAVKIFAERRAQQLHGYRHVTLRGLADASQAGGAAGTAATGAEVGTAIFPGIGTVIGAVIGAVVGWLGSKPKPVRATAEQIAQCRMLTTEYMGFAAENPNTCLPMDLAQLKQMHWCGDALYGGSVKLKDPRYFAGGFDEKMSIYRQIVRKVYETPIGANVEISGLSFKDAKGKNISLPGVTFENKVFISIKELVDRVVVPLETANCSPWGGGACPGFYSVPLIRRILYDELGYAARTELPNISEADLKAASQVAATIPSTSAKDVVSAVEMILNRPVVRDETAALLTPQAATGGAAPAPQIPVTAIAPLIPQVQANPINTETMQPQLPASVPAATPLTYQLPSPGASAGGSGYATLPSATPIRQTLAPVAAGLPGGNSLWIAGGLGILAVIFATARPMTAARRTR